MGTSGCNARPFVLSLAEFQLGEVRHFGFSHTYLGAEHVEDIAHAE